MNLVSFGSIWYHFGVWNFVSENSLVAHKSGTLVNIDKNSLVGELSVQDVYLSRGHDRSFE